MQAARIFCTAVIALGLIAAPAQAQDKAKGKATQAVTKVLLDNDKVRVTRTTFAPGAVNKADRKDRTNYIVTGSTLERTTPEGKKSSYVRKSGEAYYLKADSDTVTNVGKGPFVVVTVVQK